MYGFSPQVVKPGVTLRELMAYSVSLGNYRGEAARAVPERPDRARARAGLLNQRLKDGRVIEVMHQPMPHGGSVATYQDITQTVRAEEPLRGYDAKLERSNASSRSSPTSPRTICRSRCARSRPSATA